MTTPTGDLIDGLAPQQSSTSLRRACRVPGLSGLEGRRAPLDAAIFPKDLLEWSAACASGDVRYAEFAPAIYCLDVENAKRPHRLMAASRHPETSVEDRDRTALSARHRLVPATYQLTCHGDDRPASARPRLASLTPRQVAVLGHVLAHVKYPLWGSHLLPCSTAPAKFRVTLCAGAMIERLGYARGGDAYRALEEDLVALAQFLVRHETRGGERIWRTGAASPLLSYLHTGRCTVEHGQLTRVDCPRRDEQWVVELGSTLLTLLRAGPENFAVLGAGLWAAAGRSRIDQWMALWVSGHGYDGGEIFQYQAETFGRRMRLLPDSVARALGASATRLAELGAGATAVDPWQASAASAAVRCDPHATPDDELPLSQALAVARGCWRQIRRSVSRLVARNGLALGEWRHNERAPDVRPSQVGRALSRADLIQLRRWSGPVEAILPRARRWVVQQWGNLLSAVNGAFTELGRIAADDGPLSSWAAGVRQRYQERLEWLRSAGRVLSPAVLHRMKLSLQSELAKLAFMSPASRRRMVFTPAAPPSGLALLSG